MQVIDEKYEVLSKLGVGGQGTVYKARHSLLGDYRALKLIADELADNPEFVDRFRAEAQTMARFKHEHIVRVHDLINRSGRPYCLVLDFVDGPNLTEYLQQHGALAPRDALEVGRQLASALEHAHAFRVWHRDVKPRNVLIASDRPWRVLLTDFGIAKDQEAGDRTKTGHALFTTRYSAPEQLGWKRRRGRERTKVVVDQRTDIFGFGLVMFEMIEGRQFFAEMELADVMAWVLNRDADPIPLGATVPPAVARLVERALSRDPDERQPSMTEVLREIESAQRLVGLPRDDRHDRDDVTVVIPHRVDPEESSDVSDDQLDLQIQRLERERLRREAQRARDRAEAARERAHTVAAEELAADRYREGVAVEHRAIEAWDLSRYDEARQLFEQVTEALERAAAEARTEGVRREATAAAAVAGMARRTAEDAEAPARAAASFAAGVAAVSRADEQCAAGVHAAGVQDYATARRCFEQACAEAVETARVAAEVAVAAVLAARDGADAQRAPELAAEVYGAGEAAWCRAQDLQHERRHRGAEVALADACRLFDEASSVARERTRQADEARRLEERRRHEEREAAAARVAEAARQAEEVRRVEEARAAVSRRHAELEAAAQRQKDEAEARATQEAARKATPDRTVFIDRNAVPQTRIEVRRPVPTGSSDDDQTQVVPGELGNDEVVPPPLRQQGPGRSGWGISVAAVAVVVALAATAAWYFRFGAPPWLPAPTPPTQAPTVQPAPTAAPPTSLPPPAALQWQSVTPAADVRVMVKEGAAVEFTAQVQHPEQHPTISVGWQMDGQPVGSGARWTYQPSPSDGGKTKRVEVVATDGTAELRQQWDVAVANANRPPALATATPPGDHVTLHPGGQVSFAIKASDPDQPVGDVLSYRWFLDGKAVGSATTWVLRQPTTGVPSEVKVVVSDAAGESLTRTWSVAPGVPPEPQVVSRDPKPASITLLEGVKQAFSILGNESPGLALTYRWYVNGKESGSGRKWVFEAPVGADNHASFEVAAEVTNTAGQKAPRATWRVVVDWRLPTLTGSPKPGRLRVELGDPIELRTNVGSGANGSGRARVVWTLDGAPQEGGATLRLAPLASGVHRVEAVAIDERGLRSPALHWDLDIAKIPEPTLPPATVPTTTITPPTTAPKPLPTLPPTTVPTTASPTTRTTTTATTLRPTTSTRPEVGDASVTDQDARTWIASYRAAWEAKDVDALAALGAISSGQKGALRTSLAQYEDLQTTVSGVAVTPAGSGVQVGFERADRDSRGAPKPVHVTYRLERLGREVRAVGR